MNDINVQIQDKSYLNSADNTTKQVIKNLSLSLKGNEFVCLVGHSGCGKTSLLNILAGLDLDFTGNVTLGITLPKIGYIFQTPRLLPWRTVAENISLATSCQPDSLDFFLESMDLSHEKNHYPAQLSLGMNRRVAIARAFASNPDLLLMDEPFVSLGAPTARQVREMLIQLWQKRPHTVLFVTHDLREAIALADRLIFLSQPPMQVLSEIPVTIARNERNDERLIEDFRQQMITEHPEIQPLL